MSPYVPATASSSAKTKQPPNSFVMPACDEPALLRATSDALNTVPGHEQRVDRAEHLIQRLTPGDLTRPVPHEDVRVGHRRPAAAERRSRPVLRSRDEQIAIGQVAHDADDRPPLQRVADAGEPDLLADRRSPSPMTRCERSADQHDRCVAFDRQLASSSRPSTRLDRRASDNAPSVATTFATGGVARWRGIAQRERSPRSLPCFASVAPQQRGCRPPFVRSAAPARLGRRARARHRSRIGPPAEPDPPAEGSRIVARIEVDHRRAITPDNTPTNMSTVTVVTCVATSDLCTRPSRRSPHRALPSCITSRTFVRVARSETTLPSTAIATVTNAPALSSVTSIQPPHPPERHVARPCSRASSA